MGKGKKFLKGLGAFVWTIHVAPLGIVAGIVEEATKIDGGNIISELAYAGKSAAFNSVRRSWGKEAKVYSEATGKSSEQIMKDYERKAKEMAAKKGATYEQQQQVAKNFRDGVGNSSYGVAGKKVCRVSFQEGASWNHTAFVFSCPGQTEMRFGTVCAGTTGVNLSMALKYCHQQKPSVFPSSDKGDYLITNASDIVHFMNATNDTEASDEEILAAENLNRLRKELSGKSTIICMGERAATAVRNARIGGRIVYFDHHLSNQKLNRAYSNDMFDENLTAEERRRERIKLVAEDLLKKV